jgi:hypothetical protein
MFEVLYNVEWQVLRLSCLASIEEFGGWSTDVGVESNLKKLTKYLDNSENPIDREVRCFRVNTSMKAVVQSYKMNMKTVPENKDLLATVVEWRDKNVHKDTWTHSGVCSVGYKWTWAAVTQDLKKLHKSDPKMFEQLYENIHKRFQRTQYERGVSTALRRFWACLNNAR